MQRYTEGMWKGKERGTIFVYKNKTKGVLLLWKMVYERDPLGVELLRINFVEFHSAPYPLPSSPTSPPPSERPPHSHVQGLYSNPISFSFVSEVFSVNS